jgi:hypothetical protein
VFGKVVEGMDVVDAIEAVRTTTVAPHRDVPAEPVSIVKATSWSEAARRRGDAARAGRVGRVGAEGRTRTGTGCPTRPSNVRVYQFRHFGIDQILVSSSGRR